jgi:hypothetical protein
LALLASLRLEERRRPCLRPRTERCGFFFAMTNPFAPAELGSAPRNDPRRQLDRTS